VLSFGSVEIHDDQTASGDLRLDGDLALLREHGETVSGQPTGGGGLRGGLASTSWPSGLRNSSLA
jgi:hypothetical protein